jgi:hypothetical protein
LAPDQKQKFSLETLLAFSKAMMQGPEGQRMVAETLGTVSEMARGMTPGIREQLFDHLRNEIGILSPEPSRRRHAPVVTLRS